MERLYSLTGGHPYLVRRSLYTLATQGIDLVAFEEIAIRDEGPVGDHLKRIQFLLAKDAELTDHLRSVLTGNGCPSPKSFYRLRSDGVLVGDVEHHRFRCEVYQRYLKRHL